MLRHLRQFLIGAALATMTGCMASTLSYDSVNGWSWGPTQKKPDTFIDQAWRSGGGINNPNPERMREGKQPLNFDGSVYQP